MLVNAESCNGATVSNGTNQTIVDANNGTWIITAGNIIYKNGQPAGYSQAVMMLVYWNRTVYQENCNKDWWNWINNGWVAVTNPQLISQLTSASGCSSSTVSGSFAILSC